MAAPAVLTAAEAGGPERVSDVHLAEGKVFALRLRDVAEGSATVTAATQPRAAKRIFLTHPPLGNAGAFRYAAVPYATVVLPAPRTGATELVRFPRRSLRHVLARGQGAPTLPTVLTASLLPGPSECVFRNHRSLRQVLTLGHGALTSPICVHVHPAARPGSPGEVSRARSPFGVIRAPFDTAPPRFFPPHITIARAPSTIAFYSI